MKIISHMKPNSKQDSSDEHITDCILHIMYTKKGTRQTKQTDLTEAEFGR